MSKDNKWLSDRKNTREDLYQMLRNVQDQLSAKEKQCRELSQKIKRLSFSALPDSGQPHCPVEARLRQRTIVLEGIYQIFQKSADCKNEMEIGDICLMAAEQVTSSQFGFIGKITAENRMADIAISYPGREACQMANPMGHRISGSKLGGLFGQVLRDRKGFFTNTPVLQSGTVVLPDGHPRIEAFLGVPLLHGDQIIGLVAVANGAGGYGEADLEALEMLAPAITRALLSKRAEEMLRQKEARYRNILENIEDGYFEVDLRGDLTFFNQSLAQLLGYSREELMGMNNRRYMDQATARKVYAAYHEIYTGRGDNTIEYEITSKDGSKHVIESCVSAILDTHEKKVGFRGIARDITARKQADRALRQLNETLEQRVAERTELAEGRARQLQTLAVELLEAEEKERQRIAELLHDDLQQVLAAARFQLQGALQNLPESAMITSVAELLEQSIIKTRRLSHELSPPALHHTGLVPTLKWLANQMREQFGLQVLLEGDMAPLLAYAPLKVFLFRAVQELLFNVVKHAGIQEARVVLSDSDHGLTITVSDQGRGFDPRILDSEPAATGLGLLSLRERARHIGGGLIMESAPGQGSRFALTVPRRLTGVEAPTLVEPLAEGQVPATISEVVAAGVEGGLRLLFVDDHQVMRQGLIRLIGGQPDIMVVGQAANGREAIEQARLLRPDVVIMDISMPGMNGIEATRHIKAEFPEMRVVGLSMYEDGQVAQSMRLAGAEAMVSKTASPSELLKAIYGQFEK